jgi:hypothetical protein
MNSHLRYDICRIRDPSLLNTEVLDLEGKVKEHVPESLCYACRFWMMHWLEHIRTAESQARIPAGLEAFCAHHLLHWIEVLSLIGNLHDVQRAMPDLMLVLRVSLFPPVSDL